MSYRISRDDYIDLILWVLKERGGRDRVHDIIDAIEPIVTPYLTERDRQPTNSSPFEPRWRNDVRWARNAAVKRGLLQTPSESGHGIWALSGTGWRHVPESVPGPTSRLSHSSERTWHRSTRSTDYPHRPSSIAGQFKMLEHAMDAAIGAQPGQAANPAMGQVITTLEKLLTSPAPKLGTSPRTKAPRSTRKTSRAAPVRAPRRNSTRTGGRGPSILDASRLESFLLNSWSPSMKDWLKLKEPLTESQWQRLDLIAALPGCAALMAVHQGWVPLRTGLALSMQSVHTVLGAPQYLKRYLWVHLERSLPEHREFVQDLLQQGLLHRMLCAWLLALLRSSDDTLILQIASLRSWIDDVREFAGSPDRWESDASISRKWSDILNLPADDASIPAPDETESSINALAEWLGKQNPTQRPSSLREHRVGDLLWSHALGWGVSCSNQPARQGVRLPIYAISSARRMEKCCPIVNRTKTIFSQPWVNLSALSEANLMPAPWSEIAADLGTLARRSQQMSL